MAVGFRPATDTAPPLALPLTFMLSGLGGLLAALLDLVTHLSALLGFAYGDPAILAATHFLTLGFVSMVMMGALYQLVPVVLNVRLASVRLGALHYALFLPGVALLVSGFWGAGLPVLITGGSLVVVSVGVFLYNMGRTLRRARRWDLPGWYVATSLGYLALTVILGWLLAFNFVHPFLPVLSALPVHLTVGGIGWFTLTLMGVSYKLLPMFSLTHAKPRYGWHAYTAINVAVWAMGVGSWWSELFVVGAVLSAFLGLSWYLMDMRRLWAKRLRRKADPPVYLALTGAVMGLVTAVLVAVTGLTGWMPILPFFLFFFGWLGLSILGYLQKIIPFLVWLHRYAADIGTRPVPHMRDIWPEAWSWRIGAVYLAGLLTAGAGLATTVPMLSAIGLVLMMGGVITLVAVVVRILTSADAAPAHHPAEGVS